MVYCICVEPSANIYHGQELTNIVQGRGECEQRLKAKPPSLWSHIVPLCFAQNEYMSERTLLSSPHEPTFPNELV